MIISSGIAAVLATGVVLALPTAEVAHAVSAAEIEISVDSGVTWFIDGAPALFTDIGSLVPGASQAASIEVRNTSSGPAIVRVAEIVALTASPGLTADLVFATWAPDVPASTVSDVEAGVCTPLMDGQRLAAGETTTIDLTVTLAEASTNSSQGGTAPIAFFVSLVEDTGGALPAVTCSSAASVGGDRPARMANTGSDWMTTAGIGGSAAAALLVGGLLALAAERRRREQP